MKKYDVGWGTISACNMKCRFCYSKDVRTEVGQNNVGIKEWIEFVDNNAGQIESINYGTGENALSDDWFMLVDYISNNYPIIKQAITTNGTLYKKMEENPKYKRIVDRGISEIDVSLDFADEEKHDNLRGLRDAYKYANKLLEYCKGTNIEATLVFIGAEEVLNISNLEKLFAIANKCDCKLRTNIFRPMDINNEKLRKFIAKYSTLLNTLKWINDNHNILYLGDPLFASVLTDEYQYAPDPSGESSIRILSNGDITPSTYLVGKEFRNYNIKMDKVLQKIDFESMGLESTIPEKCKGCKYENQCRGGVLDRRYLWYKSFKERDPYCIYREENGIPDFKIKINPNNIEFCSVHKEYLPTMFFCE